MRIILLPLVFLMMPIALLVEAYEVAKGFVEQKVSKQACEKLKEKNA